jgi:hypothetical protein
VGKLHQHSLGVLDLFSAFKVARIHAEAHRLTKQFREDAQKAKEELIALEQAEEAKLRQPEK